MASIMAPAQIGVLGVRLAAAELIRRGCTVAPTSPGAFGADLLVTDVMCQKAWSIQVKTKVLRLMTNGSLENLPRLPPLLVSFMSLLVSWTTDQSFLLYPPVSSQSMSARSEGFKFSIRTMLRGQKDGASLVALLF